MPDPDEAPLRICVDRVIPATYQPARAATEQATIDHALLSIDPLDVIAVKAAMVLTKRWPNGTTLKCRFLDGDETQRAKVQEKARTWEAYANIRLAFVDDGDATVRISFVADKGSWSAVGTDCLLESYFPRYQPTMNFGWLRDDTDDEEYGRVVVHEFGHALGLIHEHQSPDAGLHWNTAEVYRVFSGPPNNWSKADIDHNILERYGETQMNWTAFDPNSIMLYAFPAQLFTDGQGTATNTHLSEMDKEFIAKEYPKTG